MERVAELSCVCCGAPCHELHHPRSLALGCGMGKKAPRRGKRSTARRRIRWAPCKPSLMLKGERRLFKILDGGKMRDIGQVEGMETRKALADLRERLPRDSGRASANQGVHADKGADPEGRRSSCPGDRGPRQKWQSASTIGDITLRSGRSERAGGRLYMRQAQLHRYLKVRQCLTKSPRKRLLSKQKRLSTRVSASDAN
jgi:hypothetical protein